MTDRQQQFELTTQAYTFTRTGLAITGESTQADWELMGQGLQAVDEARQWAIGDWLRDGKRHYGDGLYKRAAEITGLNKRTLEQYKWLSETFETSARAENLSHKHHQTVAGVKQVTTDNKGKLALSDDLDFDKISELLSEAAKHGWSIRELRDHVDRHKEQQREYIRLANEPEKYTVIYADPPWEYTSGDQHGTDEQDTVLGDHYPSMSIKELCGMPVKNMAAADAVLFMWATSPTLEEAFLLIDAWGFEYKASMVWDKVAHNVGNYVSVRHELLLICRRGQPPKVPRLVDSVYVEERTEHSRKPGYFRDLIGELYPAGRRIELFARETTDGWDVWGDEV